MDGIEKKTYINPALLDSEKYLESLLNAAAMCNMLSQADMENIQLQLISLLADLTKKLTRGISSSVRIETANEILNSINYTAGLYLKTFSSPDDALDYLQKNGVNTVYNKGRRRIDVLLAKSRLLHTAILSRLCKTSNEFYNGTVIHGIKGFFRKYNPDFAAHETIITADYPVYNPIGHLSGIEFIQSYLEHIYCENLFCTYFDPTVIDRILYRLDPKYKSLLINIYSPLLANVLAARLCDADISKAEMPCGSMEMLYGLFDGMNKNDLTSLLSDTAKTLTDFLHISDSLMKYILESARVLAGQIEALCAKNQLEKLFFTDECDG